MSSASKCEFCDKRGLPLLLVRDAVTHAGSGAPRAAGSKIELPESIAYYTKRLLRSGYVNLFDEARRRWETYFVTPEGYFAKLSQTPGVAPDVPRKPFNCPDEGHRALASCITIPDPLNATKVWIGFSDVLWTDNVRTANEDLAYRSGHMTEIDVKRALKRNRKPHLDIAELANVVAEYATVGSSHKVNIGWSPFRLNEKHDLSDRVKRECEALRPGCGLIVTLSDPAGIAQEIAALMKLQSTTFIETAPQDKRNLAASAVIEQIKEGVCVEAERKEIAAAESLADKQYDENALGNLIASTVRATSEGFNKLTSANLQSAADDAWGKYNSKFDDKERRLWLKNFHGRLAVFDKDNIAPLALTHVRWMKSHEMAAYLECNYDPLNAESGAVYTQILNNCVAGTHDKKACADLYAEWLNADISDKSNLLLRAFVLNQTATIEAIKNASTVGISLNQIPWDNIFTVHNNAVDRLSPAVQDVTAELVAQLGGPLVKMLDKVMDGSGGFRAAIMALGIVAKQPIVMVDIVDSAKNFERYLVKTLIDQHGWPLSEKRLGQLVKHELRRREIHGVQVAQSAKRRWMIAIDKEAIERMPSNLKTKQVEKLITRSIRTVDDIEKLNLNRWRQVINVNVRRGAIGAILQAVSLNKLVADEAKSLKDDKDDATWRRRAGVATIFATVAEVFGHMVAGRAGQGMKFAQGLSPAGNFFKRQAPRAGIFAGLIMAALDFNKALTEYKEGSGILVVGAYVGSALTGILLTVALVSAWPFLVIGILLAVAIGIGLLIEFVKDNPIQDWLERCPWGKLKDQRYADFETEQQQLQLALR